MTRRICVILGLCLPGAQVVAVNVGTKIFNIFNQVNYANPNASFGSAAFGTITSTLTGATMRQVQLGGKLLF